MHRHCVGLVGRSSLFLTLALPVVAAAQTNPATAAASGAQPSLQQVFNDASAAAARGDCATALPIFERLAADPRIKPDSLPAASINLRRGICMAEGRRIDEGERLVVAGLPAVRKAGPELAIDVALGEESLGDIAGRRHDRDAVIAHYKAALELVSESARAHLLVKLAKATAFDGGAEAQGYLDQALRILTAQAKPDKPSLAVVHTVRGRILMNLGRDKEALIELKQALALRGGLRPQTTLEDAAMRGDIAQAALLNGNRDMARLYLAYTGAGRIETSPFATAASMASPQCGTETGLSPNDSAIVEFGIDDDGFVSRADTVFTRGNHAVATAFARAVESWYWRPSDLASIPPFYKLLTRVELRCSSNGGQLPGITDPLLERFAAWAGPLLGGLSPSDLKSGKMGFEKLAAIARQNENIGNSKAAIAAWTLHAILAPSGQMAVKDLDKALALADTADLPSDIRNVLLVFRTDAAESSRSGRQQQPDIPAVASADAAIRSNPGLATDALAGDTLLLLAIPAAPGEPQRPAAMAAFGRVAEDRRLAEHHPLRQVALLRLANLAAASGKLDAAHDYFVRTGLSEEQCALIGVTPALQHSGATSGDYPMAAAMLGFEGWVKLEYDIGADGRTARPRALVAYPPFVFVDAATGMTKDMRYQASYRPSSSTACSAHEQTVRFILPK